MAKLIIFVIPAYFWLSACAVLACTPVSTWAQLKKEIALAELPVVFCQFMINKPENSKSILVEKSLHISCAQPRACRLLGSGNHMLIRGAQAQLTIEDFEFVSATRSAIQIKSSPNTHTIRECLFLLNNASDQVGSSIGGAITTGPGTHLEVIACKFELNEAVSGGAIYHMGNSLIVSNSTFSRNKAQRASAIDVADKASRLEISNTSLSFNTGMSQGNYDGPIRVSCFGNIIVGSSVSGLNNDACDGIYSVQNKKCFGFSVIPYDLGELVLKEYGIRLSKGLVAEIVARTGKPITFTSPTASRATSSLPFHKYPDGAAIFQLQDGFVYVSNAEIANGRGGVYGVEFDTNGRARDYKNLLSGTTWNCAGGKTPWNTWVSCEEHPNGQCWQVDPTGNRTAEKTVLGGSGGQFETFAVDDRDLSNPKFFVTEDSSSGALRRFRPPPGTKFGWEMLHVPDGNYTYLEILPPNKFRWTPSLSDARDSAYEYYRNSEGLVHQNGRLLFTSKSQKEVFDLNLEDGTYEVRSTNATFLPGGGAFGGENDQLTLGPDGLVYFTEEGSSTPGVYAYNGKAFRAVVEGYISSYAYDETTGVDFSPDGRSLFFCLQNAGILFQIRRLDGRPFKEGRRVLKWKYEFGTRV